MKKKEKHHNLILQGIGLIGIVWSSVIATASLASCADSDKAMRCDDETMYQVSTLQSLLNGGYDGYVTVGELRKFGDTGVGTFDRIDGEMIVIDGTVYQARYDGGVCVADDKLTVPFANVTHFDKDVAVTLPKVAGMDELAALLTETIKDEGLDQIYVACMDVQCDSIFVRSELPQQKPYRPLGEVLLTDQREFKYRDIGGTIVALYFPDFFDKQNSTGWHLHFVSADRTKGGHVFDIATNGNITVNMDATPYFKLYMP